MSSVIPQFKWECATRRVKYNNAPIQSSILIYRSRYQQPYSYYSK